MKPFLIVITLCTLAIIIPVGGARAQEPISEIVKAAITKVIKAVDLKIQRLQNETIWLQNAQKKVENTLSKVKLDEIAAWTEKQRELYKDYYEELSKVKSIIAFYQRIKSASDRQVQMVQEYQRAWSMFRQDRNFTSSELEYMYSVYSGMLKQSAENIGQIVSLVKSSGFQMNDAKRLDAIGSVADNIDENYFDLMRFNQENVTLSFQRSRARGNVEEMKKLHGIK